MEKLYIAEDTNCNETRNIFNELAAKLKTTCRNRLYATTITHTGLNINN